jgi:hypothetical protein
VGIASIIINVIIAFIYYGQLKEMRKATKAAADAASATAANASVRAANASVASVDVARNTFESSKKGSSSRRKSLGRTDHPAQSLNRFTFILYGEIRYTSFVGSERRSTQFCYFEPAGTTSFYPCDKLNDMN